MVITNRRSQELGVRAQRVIPGGVDSPIRTVDSIDTVLPFIKAGRSCRIEDVDGNRYIDYVGSWGALILGHAHAEVVDAINKVMERGISFATPIELEVRFAEKLCELVPSLEQVCLVNSSTEAIMNSIRLARAYTGRELIIKFAGSYHGHTDDFLVSAVPSTIQEVPLCSGITANAADFTIILPYNNLDILEATFTRFSKKIAAVILEPVAGHMGVIVPLPGFLEGIRTICNTFGALLIFDEVTTGFRIALGGAQSFYGVIPDLTCLGKIIGGGLPIGAYGGSRKIMQKIVSTRPFYQDRTLSGNPLSISAGLKVLELLQVPKVYETLDKISAALYSGLDQLFSNWGVPHYGQRVGGMFTFFFNKGPIIDWESTIKSDVNFFARFYRSILKKGIYLAPSQFKANMVSLAHDLESVEQTLSAADEALKETLKNYD